MSDYFSKETKRSVNQDAHAKSDVDDSPDAYHHTLGPRATQAAAGNHRHSVLADSFWVTPSVLLNGWVNNGGNDVPFRYCRIGGITYVQAIIKNGVSGTVVFNLSEKFRPSFDLIYDGDSGPWVIRSNGNCECFGSPARASIITQFPAEL